MTSKTVNTGAMVETNAFDANHRLTSRRTPAGGSQNYSYTHTYTYNGPGNTWT